MKKGMQQVGGKGSHKYPSTKHAPKAKRGGQSRYGGLRPNRGGVQRKGGRQR